MNPAKSLIFSGLITNSKLHDISSLIGFKICPIPFSYLRVPIFKEKSKAIHLGPILDKIKSKLSTWKASLLRFAGRDQMVKSTILAILVHNFTKYSWYVTLIKDREKSIKKFIWSGDIIKTKLVSVSWKKVCKPFD